MFLCCRRIVDRASAICRIRGDFWSRWSWWAIRQALTSGGTVFATLRRAPWDVEQKRGNRRISSEQKPCGKNTKNVKPGRRRNSIYGGQLWLLQETSRNR